MTLPACVVCQRRLWERCRVASLYPLLPQNELGVLELIHCMVETLDKWFSNVCELDIMFSLETVRGDGHSDCGRRASAAAGREHVPPMLLAYGLLPMARLCNASFQHLPCRRTSSWTRC